MKKLSLLICAGIFLFFLLHQPKSVSEAASSILKASPALSASVSPVLTASASTKAKQTSRIWGNVPGDEKCANRSHIAATCFEQFGSV